MILLAACVATSNLAIADDLTFSTPQPKSRQTLLSWNLAEQSAETEASGEVNRIVTDRPHFSEVSSLVGLGVTQIETGYSYFLNKENTTTTQTHSFPEPLLRMGIIAEWLEFPLGCNYLVQRINDPIQGQ